MRDSSMTFLRQLGLLLTIFFLYLLAGSREPPWNDAKQLHQVAESLVHRGALDIGVPTPVVRDGKYYATHPFIPSAIHVPGAALHRWVDEAWPGGSALIRVLGSHLGPSLVSALTCLFFFQLCRSLGIGVRASIAGAVTLAVATMIAVYARAPYSEAVQATCFAGFFLYLVRLCQAPGRGSAFLLGTWAGLLVNTKALFALALPGAGLVVAVYLWRQGGAKLVAKALAWVAAGGVPWLVLFLWYNHVRTGGILDSGYPVGAEVAEAQSVFGENPLVALVGFFFSPGKSLFLYCPPLLLSVFVARRFVRKAGWLWLAALLATTLPVVLLYSRFYFWHGDWCWGPRYLIFLIPPLLVPAVAWFDEVWAARRRWALFLAGAVFVSGLFVQVVGSAFYWDYYIRAARSARAQWLGQPNRAGARNPDIGGDCGPCFEDLYALHWLPQFQPILGHVWFLRNVAAKNDWVVAASNAPWAGYTRLQVNLAQVYPPRPDWWLFGFKKELLRPGVYILLGLLGGFLGSLALCWQPWARKRAQGSTKNETSAMRS